MQISRQCNTLLSNVEYSAFNYLWLSRWETERERRKENLLLFSCLGYVKARETAIMDYVHAYAKTSRMIWFVKICFRWCSIVGQSSSLPLPTIHFLSLIDCSQTLTKVAQIVCQQVKQGEISSDAIQIDTIDRCYTSKHIPKRFFLRWLEYFIL